MRSIPDTVETDLAWTPGIARLLERWQRQHDADDFTALVAILREPLVRMAARTLRRSGIRDPGACDDAVGLVLEGLFRPGAEPSSPHFDAERLPACVGIDAGWAYVRWLARCRCRDVVRAARRRDQHAAAYAAAAAPSKNRTGQPPGAPDGSPEYDSQLLHAAVAALDERSREVVALLLEGKSQAVIAHVLGVCEGTVSRLRARAIARLQDMLAR